MASDDQESAPAKWPFVVTALVIVVFCGVVLAIIFLPTRHVWTNDAYVTAHYATIAPRVPGQVVEVLVDDNQSVKAGQVLARLDPSDYETALMRSKAQLVHDEALVSDAQASVERQPSMIEESKAEAARITAQLVYARQNAQRYHNLAQTGAGSNQEKQLTDASMREMEANLRSMNARIAAAEAIFPFCARGTKRRSRRSRSTGPSSGRTNSISPIPRYGHLSTVWSVKRQCSQAIMWLPARP